MGSLLKVEFATSYCQFNLTPGYNQAIQYWVTLIKLDLIHLHIKIHLIFHKIIYLALTSFFSSVSFLHSVQEFAIIHPFPPSLAPVYETGAQSKLLWCLRQSPSTDYTACLHLGICIPASQPYCVGLFSREKRATIMQRENVKLAAEITAHSQTNNIVSGGWLPKQQQKKNLDNLNLQAAK